MTPAAIKRIATKNPALPLVYPFSERELPKPTAIDWNNTNAAKTIDKIPDISFHVFIIVPPIK